MELGADARLPEDPLLREVAVALDASDQSASSMTPTGAPPTDVYKRQTQHDLIEPRQLAASLFDRTISSSEDCANDFDSGQRTRYELICAVSA